MLPLIYGLHDIILTTEEEAEAFANSLEGQCRSNCANADVNYIGRIHRRFRRILDDSDDEDITPTSPEEVRVIIRSYKSRKTLRRRRHPNPSFEELAEESHCICHQRFQRYAPSVSFPISMEMRRCDSHPQTKLTDDLDG